MARMSRSGILYCAMIAPSLALAQTAPPAAPAHAGPAPLRLGAAVSGVIKKIDVAQDSRVSAGQALLEIDCSVLEADLAVRSDNLAAAEAAFERTRNGSRPDEIAIGEAQVGVATARAEEAQAAYDRATALKEGVTTTRALVLLAQRDARIAAAQLKDAQRKLDLLRAGSRAEDIAEAQAKRDGAAALLEEGKVQLAQCTVRAPAAGRVEVLATLGQYVSTAVPVTLVQLQPE